MRVTAPIEADVHGLTDGKADQPYRVLDMASEIPALFSKKGGVEASFLLCHPPENPSTLAPTPGSAPDPDCTTGVSASPGLFLKPRTVTHSGPSCSAKPSLALCK